MASQSAVLRTIVIPQPDPSTFDETGLPGRIAALIGNTANTVVPSFTFAYVQYYGYNGGWTTGRGVRLEFILTPTGDSLVVSRLGLIQQALGLANPIPTWGQTITYGY